MVQSLDQISVNTNSSYNFFDSPELLEIQRDGFYNFLKEGIAKELKQHFPIKIKSGTNTIELLLYPQDIKLVSPDQTIRDCILNQKTYSCKLYAPVKLVLKKNSGKILYETNPEYALLGQLPIMTKRGHFIINGSPRVIVHQVVRAPGIYFQKLIKKDSETNDEVNDRNRTRFYGDIIPLKGVWVRLQITKKGRVEARFKKGKKVQAELLQKCLQVVEHQSSPVPMHVKSTHSFNLIQSTNNSCVLNPEEKRQKEARAEHDAFIHTYDKLYRTAEDKELEEWQKKRKNKNLFKDNFIRESTTDKAFKLRKCSENLFATFKINSRYSLGELGREKINGKFGLSRNKNNTQLTAYDLYVAGHWLNRLRRGERSVDDIDHSQNRRVRTSGELLQTQFSNGVERLKTFLSVRLKEFVQNPMHNLLSLPIHSRNTRTLHPLGTHVCSPSCTGRVMLPQASHTLKMRSFHTLKMRNFHTFHPHLAPKVLVKGVPMCRKGVGSPTPCTRGARDGCSVRKARGRGQSPRPPQHVYRKRNLPHIANVKGGRMPKVKVPFSEERKNTTCVSKVKPLLPYSGKKKGALKIGYYSRNQVVWGEVSPSSCTLSKKRFKLPFLISPYKATTEPQPKVVEGCGSPSHTNNLNLHAYSFASQFRRVCTYPRSFYNKSEKPRNMSCTHGTPSHVRSLSYWNTQTTTGCGSVKYAKLPSPTHSHEACVCARGFKTDRHGFTKGVRAYGIRGREAAAESLMYSRPSCSPDVKVRSSEKKVLTVVKGGIKELFSTKPITGALREFFGSNPLSQYMDQTNPLAEITHKRRISSLGIGGVSRESAGMAIRGIHPTYYGRICPIETPEGKNAGLVNSLAFYTKVDRNGFLETPYYQVFKGQIQSELGFSFYGAKTESLSGLHIAPSDLQKSSNKILRSKTSFLWEGVGTTPNNLLKEGKAHPYERQSKLLGSARRSPPPHKVTSANNTASVLSKSFVRPLTRVNSVPVRIADNLLDVFTKETPHKVQCIGISPIQMISVATSLIPFLEHNDANRALMGSNMQRQAVPLMISERPIVGTGLESIVLVESGHITESQIGGFVSYISATKIVVDRLVTVSKRETLSAEKTLNKLTLNTNFNLNSILTTCTGIIHPHYSVLARVRGVCSPPGRTKFLHVRRLPHIGNVQGSHVLKAKLTLYLKREGSVGRAWGCASRTAWALPSPTPCFPHTCASNPSRAPLVHGVGSRGGQSPRALNNLLRPSRVRTPFYGKNGVLTRMESTGGSTTHPPSQKQMKRSTTQIRSSSLIPHVHPLTTFTRSNQNTCIREKPLVQESDWVQKGDVLSDCSASAAGELAVGKNVLLAYIPWEGYNFEDAIVISDRLVKEHVYTSLHIERYIFQAQEVTDGTEFFTKNLPGVESRFVQHLEEFGSYNSMRAHPLSKSKVAPKVYLLDPMRTYELDNMDTQEQGIGANPKPRQEIGYVLEEKVSGLPKIGSFLKEGDIMIGKVRYLNKKPSSPYERLLCDILGEKNFSSRNKSLYVPKGVEARVIHYKVINRFPIASENQISSSAHTHPHEQELRSNKCTGESNTSKNSVLPFTRVTAKNYTEGKLSFSPIENVKGGRTVEYGAAKTVHLFLGEKRVVQVGDKMSGRHGNKGVISTILPRQDMPYLPDGTPIDLILNPLGVPSRMNVGQVLECLLGLAASYLHQHFKITAFDELYGVEASKSIVYLKLYQARLQTGQNWLFQVDFPGKTRLVDGRSGECFDQWITVGKAYILKLIHMVSEKIHARGTGPYALITQQPLRGRSKKGGQRLGEMEVWALEGFGAAYTLQELLTKKSDDFFGRKQIVDSILPNPSSVMDIIKPNSRIDENKIVLGHPEIFKVLLCELQALCLDVGVYVLTPHSFQRNFLGVVH